MGTDVYSGSKRDYTIGIYPLLPDETCWFLAADFDKENWMDDVAAYLETCKTYNVPHSFGFFPINLGILRQQGFVCGFVQIF